MCKVEWCDNEKILANGYCSKHYNQMRNHGKIFRFSYKDKENYIEIVDDHAEIFLIDKNNEVCAKCLIDIEDIEKVKPFKWHKSDLQRSTYYCISNNKKWRRIHRLILGIEDPNILIDHINHNGLDNRKSNLRTCTNSQNLCNAKVPKNNKSGVKGVYWSEERQKWCTQITINRKTISLGRFVNYEDAVKTRLEAEKVYYGEFANCSCC